MFRRVATSCADKLRRIAAISRPGYPECGLLRMLVKLKWLVEKLVIVCFLLVIVCSRINNKVKQLGRSGKRC